MGKSVDRPSLRPLCISVSPPRPPWQAMAARGSSNQTERDPNLPNGSQDDLGPCSTVGSITFDISRPLLGGPVIQPSMDAVRTLDFGIIHVMPAGINGFRLSNGKAVGRARSNAAVSSLRRAQYAGLDGKRGARDCAERQPGRSASAHAPAGDADWGCQTCGKAARCRPRGTFRLGRPGPSAGIHVRGSGGSVGAAGAAPPLLLFRR